MGANDKQIGGSHYASELQHWDLIEACGIGYLEGCATKYITRARKKNGVQDLQKARHYIEKLKELSDAGVRSPRGAANSSALSRFAIANALNPQEVLAIGLLVGHWVYRDLDLALELIEIMMLDAVPVPGTPEDGGHHARQYEG